MFIHEPIIQRFSDTGDHRELQYFLEELDELWEVRTDLTPTAKSRRTWRLLDQTVQVELRTQGLGPQTEFDGLITALKKTYGDKRTVSQLVILFYKCQQESNEDIRRFSQRLHEAYRDLVAAQGREKLHIIEVKQLRSQLIDGIASEIIRQLLRQFVDFNPEAKFLDVRERALDIEADFLHDQLRPPTVQTVQTPPSELDPLVRPVSTLTTEVARIAAQQVKSAIQLDILTTQEIDDDARGQRPQTPVTSTLPSLTQSSDNTNAPPLLACEDEGRQQTAMADQLDQLIASVHSPCVESPSSDVMSASPCVDRGETSGVTLGNSLSTSCDSDDFPRAVVDLDKRKPSTCRRVRALEHRHSKKDDFRKRRSCRRGIG